MNTMIPRVAVIIPCYYSHETLERCLGALRAQTVSDFETIVVNSSPDGITEHLVTGRFPEVIFVQSPIRLLPHAARNQGACRARGELLIFTDPDCYAWPDWLARLVAAHDGGYPVVGGSMGLRSQQWLEQGIHLCKFSWALSGLKGGAHWIVPTANVCYARHVWEKLGPFEGTRFSGDALLSWRARETGFTPWFEPRAVVEHQHDETVWALWHERLTRGQEFAETRMAFERWPRSRATAYLSLLPFLVILVLTRAGRDAIKSGWGLIFFLTLPVQAVGQLAWCLGEARAHWRRARGSHRIWDGSSARRSTAPRVTLSHASGSSLSLLFEGWRTYRMIRAALASSRWPRERLRCLQEERLRALLDHAYSNVPLYRQLYDEAGFRPDEFRSLDDLDKIPILCKERLKSASPRDVVSRGIDLRRCKTVHTSGSTGTPLRVYLGPSDQQWQRAVAWRILFEHGFRWTDRTFEIRMTSGERFFLQRLGVAPKDWVSLLDPPEAWARHLLATKPEVIVAGAGTLHALAETIEALGVTAPCPRIVISDSETLAPATRRLIHRVFQTDPVDVYGLVELSNFAWECEHRQGFHVSADSHLVEVNAPRGQPGPIIATALGMWAAPMIRYETGDLADIDPRACPCGRSLPLLGRIYGRAVDSVVLPDGSRRFWPFFHEILGRYDELRQWRILQENVRLLRLQITATEQDRVLLNKIDTDLRGALPDEVTLQVEHVDRIPIAPGEKTRMVISTCSRAMKETSAEGRRS